MPAAGEKGDTRDGKVKKWLKKIQISDKWIVFQNEIQYNNIVLGGLSTALVKQNKVFCGVRRRESRKDA